MKKHYLFFVFFFSDDLSIDLIISYRSGEYSTANVLVDIDENIYNDDESVNFIQYVLMDTDGSYRILNETEYQIMRSVDFLILINLIP